MSEVSPALKSATAREVCYDVPRLLQLFESLGENCDFGVVQRAAGLEPFGLFRFSACKAPAVAELLERRFDKLCEPDDLWLDVVGEEREYWVKSRNTPFEAHTNRYADRHEEQVVRRGELDRLRYLKTHLLQDLERGKKFFVFKGESDLATMQEMAAALQLYSPNRLLWIALADAAHAPGTVARDSEHLLLGFVSRFGTYDGAPSLPIDEWVRVCAGAYRLWRNEEPPKSSVENLLSRGLEWLADPGAPTEVIEVPSPAPGLVFGHGLSVPALTPVCSTHVPLLRGGSLALSAWVNVAPTSQLKRLGLVFPGFDSVAIWDADPKIQDRWQRLWVTAMVPDEARAITCALMAEGEPGAQFQSAAWCLERGTRPSGYGFAL
jgi:hypothetical protein